MNIMTFIRSITRGYEHNWLTKIILLVCNLSDMILSVLYGNLFKHALCLGNCKNYVCSIQMSYCEFSTCSWFIVDEICCKFHTNMWRIQFQILYIFYIFMSVCFQTLYLCRYKVWVIDKLVRRWNIRSVQISILKTSLLKHVMFYLYFKYINPLPLKTNVDTFKLDILHLIDYCFLFGGLRSITRNW